MAESLGKLLSGPSRMNQNLDLFNNWMPEMNHKWNCDLHGKSKEYWLFYKKIINKTHAWEPEQRLYWSCYQNVKKLMK
jgi:hypothetical protein